MISLIHQILFLAAFFSFLWFLFLGHFWLGTHATGLKNERDGARERYADYCSKTGVSNQLFKYLFLIFSAYILYPVRGVVVALSLIAIFFLSENYLN